jgi:type II secretory pathway component PulJ
MLTAPLRRILRRPSGDAGITVMELLVSMVLSTVLGAMTLYFFVSVDKSSASADDRTISTANARNTLEAWTSYLQVSDGTTPGNGKNRFEWLTANDALFYANLYNRPGTGETVNAPTMIWLRLDTKGRLVEEQFASSAVAGTAARICRRLAQTTSAGTTEIQANTGSLQLFTPRSANGSLLTHVDLGAAPTSGAGCQPLPISPPSVIGPVDAIAVANLQTVSTVEIAFTTLDSLGTHPLEFDSMATLPALGAST